MKISNTILVLISCMLMVLLVILPGCKKRGASEGPEGTDTVQPVSTPVPTPVPSKDRYEDEISDASEMQYSDQELMAALKDINFDFDRYALTFEAREVLAQNAIYLKRNMSINLLIEGHCDERGTAEYNLSLGQKRADATKDYLVSMGIEASRIATISYGKERPLDQGQSEEAWAKNRRAHFVISSR